MKIVKIYYINIIACDNKEKMRAKWLKKRMRRRQRKRRKMKK